MCAKLQPAQPPPIEGYIPAGNARLYYRVIGGGQPLVLLHGGPDFDHSYLLPDMDRLADSFRLIYYDQRGRGRSAVNVQPEEVTLGSEIEDLESLREYFRLETAALLGHSWGGLLALEYALRHPERVSHLILMNTAPVSEEDLMLLRRDRRQRAGADIENLMARAAEARYQEGDPEAVTEYYRIHFRLALRKPEHLEQVIQRLKASFTREGILKARQIEERLAQETWFSGEYNLLPKLEGLNIPALVVHGEHDLIPIECAAHIAQAIPGARLAILKDCGHFAFLESPDGVRKEINDFVNSIIS
jgi:proline iminopeptidase